MTSPAYITVATAGRACSSTGRITLSASASRSRTSAATTTWGTVRALDQPRECLSRRTRRRCRRNSFADAFLAPRQAVRNWAKRHPDPFGLELVVRVGAFFGISAEGLGPAGDAAGPKATVMSRLLAHSLHGGYFAVTAQVPTAYPALPCSTKIFSTAPVAPAPTSLGNAGGLNSTFSALIVGSASPV